MGPTLGTCLELGAAGAGSTVGVLGPKVPRAPRGTEGPETKGSPFPCASFFLLLLFLLLIDGDLSSSFPGLSFSVL